MTSQGRPLPKFGEWDVNNPASADGFTVIFAKARDEKKATGTSANSTGAPPPRNDSVNTDQARQAHYSDYPERKKSWLCCF